MPRWLLQLDRRFCEVVPCEANYRVLARRSEANPFVAQVSSPTEVERWPANGPRDPTVFDQWPVEAPPVGLDGEARRRPLTALKAEATATVCATASFALGYIAG